MENKSKDHEKIPRIGSTNDFRNLADWLDSQADHVQIVFDRSLGFINIAGLHYIVDKLD